MLFIRRRFRQGRPDGSMLIELVVAIAVVAVGLLAMVLTTPIQLRAIKRAQAVNYMTKIAQDRIDELRSEPFNSYDGAGVSPISQNVTIRMTDDDLVVTKTFQVDTQIDAYNNTTCTKVGITSLADLSTATKKVVWVKVSDPNDRIRPPRVVQMETTIADRN
jgi:Tfp pilus assembly protein PilV